MGKASDKMIAKLNGASANGGEGGLNSLGGGIKYEWSVRLENVSADIQRDEDLSGVWLEVFTVKGTWTSHVKKDEYAATVRIDQKWGNNATPYGNFSVQAKALDGGVTSSLNVDVDNYNDEPNKYAREKAEGLLRQKLAELVTGI